MAAVKRENGITAMLLQRRKGNARSAFPCVLVLFLPVVTFFHEAIAFVRIAEVCRLVKRAFPGVAAATSDALGEVLARFAEVVGGIEQRRERHRTSLVENGSYGTGGIHDALVLVVGEIVERQVNVDVCSGNGCRLDVAALPGDVRLVVGEALIVALHNDLHQMVAGIIGIVDGIIHQTHIAIRHGDDFLHDLVAVERHFIHGCGT